MRMNAVEFQSSKFFDNILVSTMKYMENFAEKTRDDKGQFMKGLLRVLPQFPERVLYRKVRSQPLIMFYTFVKGWILTHQAHRD